MCSALLSVEEKCGVDIEIAHIGDPTDNAFDNGVPVCYGCHARMGAYNDKHPRGSKITLEEIKASRELVYEKHTRPYVAPIDYSVSQAPNPWALSIAAPRVSQCDLCHWESI